MPLVNTNRFPNGLLIAMSWLPQGMACLNDQIKLSIQPVRD